MNGDSSVYSQKNGTPLGLGKPRARRKRLQPSRSLEGQILQISFVDFRKTRANYEKYA